MAASFLRHDLPFRMVTGMRLGLLFRPSVERGFASPVDASCEDEASCALVPHCDPHLKPAARARLMAQTFMAACKQSSDLRALKQAFLTARCAAEGP